jgi:hypothetical protein
VRLRPLLYVVACFGLAACQNIGTSGIERDRVGYADAMAASWKRQMLLNIVKLRYFDTPVFVDVSSIVGAYQIEGQASLGSSMLPHTTVSSTGSRTTSTGSSYLTLGVEGSYLERPTITYAPLAGEKFVAALLKPIPPEILFAMIGSGHPADFILRIGLDAIDGFYNRSATLGRTRAGDPTFDRIVDALGRIQQAGALGSRTEKHGSQTQTWVWFRQGRGGEVGADIDFIKRQLGLTPAKNEFLIASDQQTHGPDEIVLLTRSMQQILANLGAGVQVPKQDVAEGRATAIPPLPPDAGHGGYPFIHVSAGTDAPQDAFAAARYHGHWFWIDDRDLNSKRTFMFLMIFSSLAETGVVPQTPLLTLPVR